MGFLADIRPLENGPAAFLSDACGNGCSVRLVSVGHHYRRAFAGKQSRDAFTHPGARPGNDGDTIF